MNFINVKRIRPEALIPTQAYKNDAGWDLYSCEGKIINPQEIVQIKTGLQFEIQTNCFGKIMDKSSLALKGLQVLGGVIDSNYRGEVIVILINHSVNPYFIEIGSKVAQIVFIHGVDTTLINRDTNHVLGITDRNDKGFGSSGI